MREMSAFEREEIDDLRREGLPEVILSSYPSATDVRDGIMSSGEEEAHLSPSLAKALGK